MIENLAAGQFTEEEISKWFNENSVANTKF
jgi:hypothetical protein